MPCTAGFKPSIRSNPKMLSNRIQLLSFVSDLIELNGFKGRYDLTDLFHREPLGVGVTAVAESFG